LFIYNGGESDVWVETLIDNLNSSDFHKIKMIECVDALEEEDVIETDGHKHHHLDEGGTAEYDEHVWTSPQNAADITRAIGQAMAEIDQAAAELYQGNAEAYAKELESLDGRFEAFFDNAASRTIVFGDRFPLRYFAERYDLDYYAAFPGCGTQTEPSAATVAFLTEKVSAEQIPTIWYIEFSNHLVADCIAEATQTRTAMFHTCHNVTKAEMDSGATYRSLMEENLETLRQYFT